MSSCEGCGRECPRHVGKSRIQFGCGLNARFVPRRERVAMAQHAQGLLQLRSGFRERAQTPAERLNLDRQRKAARDDKEILF